MDEEPEEMDRDMAGLHGVEEQAEGNTRGLNSLQTVLCSLIPAANIWQFLSLRTSIFLIISLVSFQYKLSCYRRIQYTFQNAHLSYTQNHSSGNRTS